MRRLQTLRVIIKIESVAALRAEKFAVDPRAVAIVAANDLVVTNAQCGFASIGTMRANGADMFHLPRPRVIAISAAGERAHRANIDALPAFVAFQMIAVIRRNQRNRAAVNHTQRTHAHTFIAGANTAEAKNTARPVVENHG